MMVGLFCLGGCTDKRTPPPVIRPPQPEALGPSQMLIPVVDLRYDEKITQVYQMSVQDNALHLTGKPFGYMKWDIASNPENPNKYFAVSEHIDHLFGQFIVDNLVRGALGVIGTLTVMSGDVGATVINTGQTRLPQEVFRYPAFDPNSTVPNQDFHFVWNAVVSHPQSPTTIFAFNPQDYYLRGTVSSGGLQMNIQQPVYYRGPGQTDCCVRRTTVFGDKLFVAWTSKLVFYSFNPDGSLSQPTTYAGLQAVNVASTGDRLYIQHQNNFSNPGSMNYPDGIYVFDRSGIQVGFLQPDLPPKVFAVSPDNLHMYANFDDTAVRVYRIVWQPTQ